VLTVAGLRDAFQVTVSSEEVPRGKPAPDVYLEAVRRLGPQPNECAAVEDSANGIRSAEAAGLHVVAIPNHDFPPPDSVLMTARSSSAACGSSRWSCSSSSGNQRGEA
jgi:beta-phosphoglucomutase-like phosphatase (HAD superfamily)